MPSLLLWLCYSFAHTNRQCRERFSGQNIPLNPTPGRVPCCICCLTAAPSCFKRQRDSYGRNSPLAISVARPKANKQVSARPFGTNQGQLLLLRSSPTPRLPHMLHSLLLDGKQKSAGSAFWGGRLWKALH